MSNLNEMVQAAQNKNPARFEELFEQTIMERLGEALTDLRAEVVSEMFGLGEEDGDGSSQDEVEE